VQTLRKHERATGVDFKEVFGKDHADSFLLLESGRADAFVMDGQILAGNISRAKNPADFKIVGEVLSVEPIAIMLRKDDPAFKKAVDDSIVAQIKSGDLAKTYDKWFNQPIPPSNTKVGLPLSDATKAAWAAPNDKPMEDYAKK
jgi:glutamate/aspartate transport system substrate-binding protein